jgi:ubiquinone/menaquinone biosynthesis C-methylase UbiE
MRNNKYDIKTNTPDSIDIYQVMSLLPVLPYQLIADVGCADGSFTVPLSKLVYKGNVVALDISMKNLALTRKILKKTRLTNAKTKVIKNNIIPIPDENLDGATVNFLFDRTENPDLVIADLVRSLKKNAWVAMIEQYGDNDIDADLVAVSDCKNIAEKHGLRFYMKHNLSNEICMILFWK